MVPMDPGSARAPTRLGSRRVAGLAVTLESARNDALHHVGDNHRACRWTSPLPSSGSRRTGPTRCSRSRAASRCAGACSWPAEAPSTPGPSGSASCSTPSRDSFPFEVQDVGSVRTVAVQPRARRHGRARRQRGAPGSRLRRRDRAHGVRPAVQRPARRRRGARVPARRARPAERLGAPAGDRSATSRPPMRRSSSTWRTSSR